LSSSASIRLNPTRLVLHDGGNAYHHTSDGGTACDHVCVSVLYAQGHCRVTGIWQRHAAKEFDQNTGLDSVGARQDTCASDPSDKCS